MVFNGILRWATKDALFEGLLKLIDSPKERLRMQKDRMGNISDFVSAFIAGGLLVPDNGNSHG